MDAQGTVTVTTIKFIIAVGLGAIFAIVAIEAAALLLNHMYWSLGYSVAALIISTIVSILCFRWALRSGIRRSTQVQDTTQR